MRKSGSVYAQNPTYRRECLCVDNSGYSQAYPQSLSLRYFPYMSRTRT